MKPRKKVSIICSELADRKPKVEYFKPLQNMELTKHVSCRKGSKPHFNKRKMKSENDSDDDQPRKKSQREEKPTQDKKKTKKLSKIKIEANDEQPERKKANLDESDTNNSRRITMSFNMDGESLSKPQVDNLQEKGNKVDSKMSKDKKNKSMKSSTQKTKQVIMQRKLTNSEFVLLRQNKKLGRSFVLPAREIKESVDKRDIWFSGVDPALVQSSKSEESCQKTLVKKESFEGLTRRVAIDCEFVGVGYDGKDDCLARVSIVNQFGQVLLDKFVLPREKVTDYRTKYSGIRPADLKPDKAEEFQTVHNEVAKIIKDRILIGHAVHNDLTVLLLSHPRRDLRDTSHYKPFRAMFQGRIPSLKQLTKHVLDIAVQEDEHDSVEDARAAMRLYMSVKTVWEAMLSSNNKERIAKLRQSIPCGESDEQLKKEMTLTKHQRYVLNRMRRKGRPKEKKKT